jgi:hypothetical protein
MTEDCDWEDMYGQAFRIAGCCAKCKAIYDITRHGFLCPSCASKNISWATREDVIPPAGLRPQGSERQPGESPVDWVKRKYETPDFSGHDADIVWLEALHKLEDNR